MITNSPFGGFSVNNFTAFSKLKRIVSSYILVSSLEIETFLSGPKLLLKSFNVFKSL